MCTLQRRCAKCSVRTMYEYQIEKTCNAFLANRICAAANICSIRFDLLVLDALYFYCIEMIWEQTKFNGQNIQLNENQIDLVDECAYKQKRARREKIVCFNIIWIIKRCATWLNWIAAITIYDFVLKQHVWLLINEMSVWCFDCDQWPEFKAFCNWITKNHSTLDLLTRFGLNIIFFVLTVFLVPIRNDIYLNSILLINFFVVIFRFGKHRIGDCCLPLENRAAKPRRASGRQLLRSQFVRCHLRSLRMIAAS